MDAKSKGARDKITKKEKKLISTRSIGPRFLGLVTAVIENNYTLCRK